MKVRDNRAPSIKAVIVLISLVLALNPLLYSAPFALADDEPTNEVGAGDVVATDEAIASDASNDEINNEATESLSASVDDNTTEGDQANSTASTLSKELTAQDSSAASIEPLSGSITPSESSKAPQKENATLTVTSAFSVIHADETKTNAPLTKLGGFTVQNKTEHTLNNKRVRITFDGSGKTYRVSAVNLLCGATGAKNIVVKTAQKPNGFKITSLASNKEYSQGSSYFAFLNVKDRIGKSDYITSIEYDMGTIKRGSYTNTLGSTSESPDALYYYGKLVSQKSGGYSAKIEFLDKGERDLYKSDGSGITNRVTIATGDYCPSYSINMTDGGSQVEAGTTSTFTLSANLGSYRYSPSNTGAYEGVIFYIRQPESLGILEDTIEVTQDGKELNFKVIDTDTDNVGNRVVKVEVPKALIGWHSDSGEQLPSVTLSVDLKTSKNTQEQSISLSDIFGVTLSDASCSGHSLTSTKDEYNMVGQGTNHFIGSPSGTWTILASSLTYANITFDSQGALEKATIDTLTCEALAGDIIKDAQGFPADPTKKGFVFLGWKLPDGTMLADSTVMPLNGIKLTAVWSLDSTIVDPGKDDPVVTKPASDKRILIKAKSFTLTVPEAKACGNQTPAKHFQELIERGKVKAWLASNNKKVEITGIDIRPQTGTSNKFGSGIGEYYLTYYAESGGQEVSSTISFSVR